MRRGFIVMCIVCAVAVVGTSSAAYAAPPSNDEVAAATVVTGVPYSDAVDTSEATYSATDTGCGVATVWYQFTPTEDTRVEFEASSSEFEPLIGLHTGDPSSLSLQLCTAYPARIFWDVTAGTTYYLSVGTYAYAEPGDAGPGGNVIFSLEQAGPPLTSVSMTVNRTGTVNRVGVATISGTVTCDQPALASFGIYLTQRFNRNVAQGYGYAYVSCGPTPISWTAQVSTYSGTVFGAGGATFQAFVYAYDEQGSYVSSYLEGSLRLNRR